MKYLSNPLNLDSQMFPFGTTKKFNEFMNMSDEQQRDAISDVTTTIYLNLSNRKREPRSNHESKDKYRILN